jgi:hypothetical protein
MLENDTVCSKNGLSLLYIGQIAMKLFLPCIYPTLG